jgi:prepilin-type N-terminal cleavage/methylation domain-containing protein
MDKLIKKAFTLIELLVVIAIIGILSGLIVVSMSGLTQKATVAKAQVFSNSLRNSLMLNLVAEYKLEGNVNNSWSSNYNGSLVGVTASTDCIFGYCYYFDGDNDLISLSSSLIFTPTQPWSFEHWMKWDMTNRVDTHVFYAGAGGVRPNMLLRYADNNRFVFRSNGFGTSAYLLFPLDSSNSYLNKWTHLVWSADGNGNLYLYINGIFLGNLGSSGAVDSSMDFSFVGRGYSARDYITYPGNTYYFKGIIDEIRIYNAAIPTSQIKEQYYSGLNKLLANGSISQSEYLKIINETAQK